MSTLRLSIPPTTALFFSVQKGRTRALNLNLKIGLFNVNAQYDNHHPRYTTTMRPSACSMVGLRAVYMTLEGDTHLPRLHVHYVDIRHTVHGAYSYSANGGLGFLVSAIFLQAKQRHGQYQRQT